MVVQGYVTTWTVHIPFENLVVTWLKQLHDREFYRIAKLLVILNSLFRVLPPLFVLFEVLKRRIKGKGDILIFEKFVQIKKNNVKKMEEKNEYWN